MAEPQVVDPGPEGTGAYIARPSPAATGDSRAAEGRAYLGRLEQAFEEAARGAGGPLDRTLAIGSARVRLRFAGEALLDSVLPAVAHLETGGDPSPTMSVSVWDSASTGVGVPTFPWAADDVVARGEVRGYSDDVRVVYEPTFGGVTVFDPVSHRGVFWVPGPDRVPWYERAAPLRPNMNWGLTGRERHFLHAAAVARDGVGVLVGGRGGSGKSTVALLCATAGLDYLGDDYVLLSTEGEPTAFSLYGTAKLAPEGTARVPALYGTAGDLAGGAEKLVLDVHGRRRGRVRAAAAVGAIVLPRVVPGAPTRLARASAAEALRRLAPSSILQLPHPQPGALASMATLVARVPAFVLELGADVSAVPELIAGLTEGDVPDRPNETA